MKKTIIYSALLFICFLFLTGNINVVHAQDLIGLLSLPEEITVMLGQEFEVTMTVKNRTDEDVTINDILGSVNEEYIDLISGPESNPMKEISRNREADFKWKCQAINVDSNISFTFTVSGQGSMGSYTIDEPLIINVNVVNESVLKIISLKANETTINEGQDITVTVTVENRDTAAPLKGVIPLRPTITIIQGKQEKVYLKSPASHTNIVAGDSYPFEWKYGTEPGSTGKIKFSVKTQSETVTIQTPLEIVSVTINPPQISEGQSFTVTMKVKNRSITVIAENVEPDLDWPTPIKHVNLESPSPLPVLKSEEPHDFTWTYNTQLGSSGKFECQGTVKGIYASSGNPIPSPEIKKSNLLTIQRPASLEITEFMISPSQINEGQSFTVTMKVKNKGGATAENVEPDLHCSTPINVNLESSPSSLVQIKGGEPHDFTWTYNTQSGSSGKFECQGTVKGIDANSGIEISSSEKKSNPLTIQKPVSLDIVVFTISPPQISEGQSFTVTMKVKNKGGATAENVEPDLHCSTPINVNLESSPSSLVQIKGGEPHDFTWTYNTQSGSSGKFECQGTVKGIDANSGIEISSSEKKSNPLTIQSPPVLKITSLTMTLPNGDGKPVNVGQYITFNMTIKNEGQATAVDVKPSIEPSLSETINLINSNPDPDTLTLELVSGEDQTFSFIYEATSPAKIVTFSGKATGRDFNSNETVKARPFPVRQLVTMEHPMKFSISFPETFEIIEGQSFIFKIVVHNKGDAEAKDVTPTIIGDPAENVTISAPRPSSPTPIRGGGKQTFTYDCTAKKAGNLTLFINVQGTDYNSGETVFFEDQTSIEIQSLPPPILKTTNVKAEPNQISEGQDITVTVTVENSGQTGTVGVLPKLKLEGVTDNIVDIESPEKAPDAENIAGGETKTFEWVYATKPSQQVPDCKINDTITFTATASDEDYWQQSVEPTGKNSDEVIIQMPAALQAEGLYLSIEDSDLSIGEMGRICAGKSFKVKLKVKNIGEADAVDVTLPEIKPSSDVPFLLTAPQQTDIIKCGDEYTHTFEWEYSIEQGASQGVVTFAAANPVTGVDFNSKDNISSNNPGSVRIEIQKELPPSEALKPEISVDNIKASAGQTLNITMSVTNISCGSERVAVNVKPSLEVTPPGDNDRLSGPTPKELQIEPQKTGEFQWTYKTNLEDVPGISFQGNAEGTIEGEDAGWPQDAKSPVTVQRPAKLEIPKSLISINQKQLTEEQKITVTEGQKFPVKVTVTNTGGATAEKVMPLLQPVEGWGKIRFVSSPEPPTADIPGGGSQEYEWTYEALAKGKIEFTVKAFGVESPPPPVTFGFEIVTHPVLEVELVLPEQISKDQNFEVVMMVTNKGGATAIDVIPELTIEGDDKVELVSGPEPTTGQIPGDGGSQEYRWTYKAIDKGEITFTGKALGHDANSDAKVESPEVTSGPIEIFAPPKLNVEKLELRVKEFVLQQISNGQEFEVVMTVTNEGEATAIDVTPELSIEGDGKVELVSGPEPTTGDIPGGGSQEYKWTYKAIDKGKITFTGGIGLQSNEVTADVTIQTPPDLKCTLEAEPNVVNEGQEITFNMTVTNNGEATAINVLPSELIGIDKANNLIKLLPRFQGITLKSGASAKFNDNPEWSYIPPEGSTGKEGEYKIIFRGHATGIDENLGIEIISKTCEVEVTIQKPISLTSVIDVAPAQISEGQEITVTMTVMNEGKALAKGVKPLALVILGKASEESGPILIQCPAPPSGEVSEESEPILTECPVPADIPGGENQEYIWKYTTAEGDAAVITFIGNVEGTDINTGKSVSSTETTSPVVTIQTQARLISEALQATPDPLNEGQTITLEYTVKNIGQATAINVTPSEPKLIQCNLINPPEGPFPESAELEGGQSQTFEWTYQTQSGDACTIQFAVDATGNDKNSNVQISSDQKISNEVRIQIPAQLEIILKPDVQKEIAEPKITAKQEICVTMTVKNIGEADAILEKVELDVGSGELNPGCQTESPPELPAEIKGGKELQFQWTYTAPDGIEKETSVPLIGTATGIDVNSEKEISGPSQAVIIVVPEPKLVISEFKVVNRTQFREGQDITVTVEVKNEGSVPVIDVNAGGFADGCAGEECFHLKIRVDNGVEYGVEFEFIIPSEEKSITLNPGEEQLYIWGYSTEEIGRRREIIFAGHAEGKSKISGELVSSLEKETPVITIQTPAHLSCGEIQTYALMPGTRFASKKFSEGQKIEVTFTVTNDGVATASQVKAKISLLGTSALPARKPIQEHEETPDLAGGESHDFVWVYDTISGDAGTIEFTATATGNDENLGEDIEIQCEAKPTVHIQQPPNLITTLEATPAQISEGQEITVTMTVVNQGEALAKDVTPSELVISGKASEEAGPILKEGPNPQKEDIPGGSTKEYTWKYTTAEGDAAVVTFTGNAEGTDINSGESVSSTETPSSEVTIQTPPHLEISSLAAEPGKISEEQSIELTMKVKNNGQAVVINITPSVQFVTGSLTNPTPGGPTPAEIDELGKDEKKEFTWTFQTQKEDAGIVKFEVRATGYDKNNPEKPIQSEKESSNEVHIQVPTNLEAKFKTDLQRVSSGMVISGTMVVTNTGGAKAIAVQPKNLTAQLDGEEPQPIEITPEPVEIESGETKEFSWTYSTPNNIEEEVQVFFDGAITGKDDNSKRIIEAPAQKVAVSIFIPPDILTEKIHVEKIDNPEEELIGIKQKFNVKVEIRNRGTVTAIITPRADDLILQVEHPDEDGDEFLLTPDKEYKILSPRPDSPPKPEQLEGGESKTLLYELQTNDKTPSGKVIIRLGKLDIVDENTKESKTPIIPPDIKAEEEFDMNRPRLLFVVYKNANSNGKVEKDDKLFLTFSERVKLKARESVLSIGDVSANFKLCAGDKIGNNPKISVFGESPKVVIITLGDNPILHPEGIYSESNTSSSCLGIVENSDHIIIDFAGNTPSPLEPVDIDIEDTHQPLLLGQSPDNETVNDMPIFFLRVTDDGPAFDSGIDLNSLEFILDEQTPLKWHIQYPSTPEYLRDGTPITAVVEITGPHLIAHPSNQLQVEGTYLTVFSTWSAGEQNEILQDFYKDIVLKIVFEWAPSPGQHTLKVIIRDNKGNVIQEPLKLTFNVLVPRKERQIIDLVTYPNPFKSGGKTVIRYILAEDIDNIELNIYDVSGRLVRIFKESGKRGLNDNISWDGKTEFGDKVAAGVYICELVTRDDKKYWRIAVLP